MNILITEDDKRLANSIKTYLDEKGHDVQHYLSGAEAGNALMNNSYDAVITDMQMPRGSGLYLLQFASAVSNPPPFYVHSSENIFYEEGRSIDLENDISKYFEFAIFRSKKIPEVFQEIQKWLDDIKENDRATS